MSDTSITPSGNAVPAGDLVATDGITITGTGNARDPLTVIGSTNLLDGTVHTAGATIRLGAPVVISSIALGGHQTSFALGIATDTPERATIAGIVVDLDTPNRVQTSGVVTLTEDEWDAVAGTTGGLVQGDNYYVYAEGSMEVAFLSPGAWSTRVGVALNTTQMLLWTPGTPVEIL